MSQHLMIEVRGFKWPKRPTSVAMARLLGEDKFGRWLGVAEGDPWRYADGSGSGVFEMALVKLVPHGTYWTVCFRPTDPVVDIDIVLPVSWVGDVLEEVDLELDVLRSAAGEVSVRDREDFERLHDDYLIPNHIATAAEETCEQLRVLAERGLEPFGRVGHDWLRRFMAEEI